MACSQALLSQINDDYLTCQICMEPYQSPKVLTCQHSFCTSCLESCDKTAQGSYILCPICRQRTILGLKGIEGLKNNFVLSNIIDMLVEWRRVHTREGQRDNTEMCQTCPSNDATMATYQCIECLDQLCADCAAFHSRTKLTRDHEVVPLHEIENGKHKDKIHSQEMSRCTLHEPLKLEQYCSKCDLLICRDCIIAHHQGHPLMPIKDAVRQFKFQVQEIQGEMEFGVESSRKSLEELIQIEEEERQELAQVEQDIERLTSDFISLIKEKRATLLKETEDIQNKKLSNLSVAKEHLEVQLRCMLNCTQLSSCVLQDGTAAEILSLRKRVAETMNELKETAYQVQENYKESIAQDHYIRYTPGNIAEHTAKGMGVTEKIRSTKAKQISLNVFIKPSERVAQAEEDRNGLSQHKYHMLKVELPVLPAKSSKPKLGTPVAKRRHLGVNSGQTVKEKQLQDNYEQNHSDVYCGDNSASSQHCDLKVNSVATSSKQRLDDTKQYHCNQKNEPLFVQIPDEKDEQNTPTPSPRVRAKNKESPKHTQGLIKEYPNSTKPTMVKPSVIVKPTIAETPDCYKITRAKGTVPVPVKSHSNINKVLPNHFSTLPHKPTYVANGSNMAVVQPCRAAPKPPKKPSKVKIIPENGYHTVATSKPKVKSYKKAPAPLPPKTSHTQATLQADIVKVFGNKGQGYRDFQAPPLGVAMTIDKTLVLDSHGQQLVIFNSDGFYMCRFTVNIPNQGKLKPINLAVSPTNQVYVLYKNIVTVWSYDGTLLTLFGHGELYGAHGIAVDSQGRVIVSDLQKHQVIVFNKHGQKVLEFGQLGEGNHHFQGPRYVCATSRDEIVVSDHNNHCVKIFDKDGKFLMKMGGKGYSNENVSHPEGIAAVSPGKGRAEAILVADEGNNRIVAFDLQGCFKCNVVEQANDLGLKSPQCIAVSLHGKLVVLQTNSIQARMYELHTVIR
ncbi:unnamed protein product [Clavelina lepadiformis]|uniref:RING-type E3 ubiquitin transferase n=1 Tax=Clavelina lepadiformis TaxID=159417 RepID=A0ABP0GST1_CLALP